MITDAYPDVAILWFAHFPTRFRSRSSNMRSPTSQSSACTRGGSARKHWRNSSRRRDEDITRFVASSPPNSKTRHSRIWRTSVAGRTP